MTGFWPDTTKPDVTLYDPNDPTRRVYDGDSVNHEVGTNYQELQNMSGVDDIISGVRPINPITGDKPHSGSVHGLDYERTYYSSDGNLEIKHRQQ